MNPPVVVISTKDVSSKHNIIKHPTVHYVFAGEADPLSLYTNEDAVVLDMAEDGQTVLTVRSLDPNWMVTDIKSIYPSSINVEIESNLHSSIICVNGVCIDQSNGKFEGSKNQNQSTFNSSQSRSRSRGRQSLIGSLRKREESLDPGNVIENLVKEFKDRNSQLQRVVDMPFHL